MQDSDPKTNYRILPYSRFFETNRRLVEYDLHPGNTVTFFAEVDLTGIESLRAASGEKRPSYTAFVVKAVALALREYPYANRRVCRRAWFPFSNPRLQQFYQCDVAVACERNVADEEAIAFVDILREADQLSLAAITDWLRALSVCDVRTNQQWRSFSSIIAWLPPWLSALLIRLPYFIPSLWIKYRGASVLVSSPAKYGVDSVSATWAWPLGVSFGLVKPRPVVRDNKIIVCPTFLLTLNFDRRIMAGAQAAHLFQRMVRLLEDDKSELYSTSQPSLATSLNKP